MVLSDGMDTGSDIGLTMSSKRRNPRRRSFIRSSTPARRVSYRPARMLGQALSRGLERLARETGGLTFPNPGRKTSAVFSRIESDLRNLYVLGFTPPVDARDGEFHKLDVKIGPGRLGRPLPRRLLGARPTITRQPTPGKQLEYT